MPTTSSGATTDFLTKYKSRGEVEQAYSPALWSYAARYPEKAYMAECPTLAQYDKAYGQGSSGDWIYIQVLALFGSSSSRDASLAGTIRFFADSFAHEASRFKLSELMLFFARYKAGRYDNSYQTFDTRRIGSAFFHEFLPQRNMELEAISRKQQQEQSLKNRELPEGYTVPEGYNPYTWYQEQCRQKGTKPLF